MPRPLRSFDGVLATFCVLAVTMRLLSSDSRDQAALESIIKGALCFWGTGKIVNVCSTRRFKESKKETQAEPITASAAPPAHRLELRR